MAGEQNAFEGQPFTFGSSLYNDLLEMRREWRRTRHEKPAQASRAISLTDRVQVRNDTGSEVRRGEVLGFTDYLLEEVNGGFLWMKGDEYDNEVGYGIARRDVADGKIEDFQVSGVCTALVNFTDPRFQYAYVKAGEKLLEACAFGPIQILHRGDSEDEEHGYFGSGYFPPSYFGGLSPSPGTGEQTCVVRIGYPIDAMLGKTDAAHAKNASGTVSVWTGAPGSETDSGQNVTAYNHFANVAINKKVWVQFNGYGWYLIAAEC